MSSDSLKTNKRRLLYAIPAIVLLLSWSAVGLGLFTALEVRSPRRIGSGVLAVNLWDGTRTTRISGHEFVCHRPVGIATRRICVTEVAGNNLTAAFVFADSAQTNLEYCQLEYGGLPRSIEVCNFVFSGNRDPLPAILIMGSMGISQADLETYRSTHPIDQLTEDQLILASGAYTALLALICSFTAWAIIPGHAAARLLGAAAILMLVAFSMTIGLSYWGFRSGFID